MESFGRQNIRSRTLAIVLAVSLPAGAGAEIKESSEWALRDQSVQYDLSGAEFSLDYFDSLRDRSDEVSLDQWDSTVTSPLNVSYLSATPNRAVALAVTRASDGSDLVNANRYDEEPIVAGTMAMNLQFAENVHATLSAAKYYDFLYRESLVPTSEIFFTGDSGKYVSLGESAYRNVNGDSAKIGAKAEVGLGKLSWFPFSTFAGTYFSPDQGAILERYAGLSGNTWIEGVSLDATVSDGQSERALFLTLSFSLPAWQ